ncbi:unnamed protein product [Prorocentrum cordatum]|uniref:Uncharacterized protein n=1 Tax=Prorocentrum cordatum TaxID=2364126 RepID=A0ABN9QTV8_9DINO|nr:unnamed protein product [Polarella glacialis]
MCLLHPMALKKLSGVYMRFLRRTADDPRYSKDVEMSSLEVRRALNMPSLDCVLQIARLIRKRPKAVLGLLFAGADDPELPWLALVRADTDHVRALGLLPGSLHLYSGKEKWPDLLQSPTKWSNVLGHFFFVESALVRQAHEMPGVPSVGRGLDIKCAACHACFPSERALARQCRSKRGHRLAIKSYIDGSGTCPCCGTHYRSRLGCVAYLSDRRRPRCAEWAFANYAPLEPSTFENLAEKAR